MQHITAVDDSDIRTYIDDAVSVQICMSLHPLVNTIAEGIGTISQRYYRPAGVALCGCLTLPYTCSQNVHFSALLVSNINLNVTNSRGWSALMFAARNGHEDVVKLLLQKGAKLDQRNNLGQTAYDIASFWSHYGTMSALKPTDDEMGPQEPSHFFTVKDLNRASEKRKDGQWLSETLLSSSHAQLLVFVETFPVLDMTGKQCKIKRFKPVDLRSFIDIEKHEASEIVFLGNKAEGSNPSTSGNSSNSIFAVNITKDKYKDILAEFSGANLHVLTKIRDAFILDADEAALAGLAHSILEWHTRCTYCQLCGNLTRLSEAGYKRTCTNDSCLSVKEITNTSYPRLDPTIIAAIVSPDGTRILLAKGRKFIPKMWSCLAGFMEPGESIEDACRREIGEESGVQVGRVSYHSSQPWPFPTQLMIGLIGQALTDNITVDKSELDDARWFTRAEVVKMMNRTHPDGYFLPPHQAIAHHLVKAFLHRTASRL